ncbi:MAG: magnesium/cobalt transporter CorA [Pseudomonadota bacterium]
MNNDSGQPPHQEKEEARGAVAAAGNRLKVIKYAEDIVQEKTVKSIEDAFLLEEGPGVLWIDVEGLGAPAVIDRIGARFNIHPLLLEDIRSLRQRPKIDDFDDYLFVILKTLSPARSGKGVRTSQTSLVIGPHYLVSFQAEGADLFEPVRQRIRNGKSRLRAAGTDYLAYALMDTIIDEYFLVLEQIGEDIDSLEEHLITNPTRKTPRSLHGLKRQIISARKVVWPLREVISMLERSESPLLKKETRMYLRDLYDHTIQIIDTVDTYRDMLSSMMDIYLSSISNRMNEIMKVLTIIATIFIPLTFIAGVYGMNFRYMPELEWHWGYYMVLGIMFAIAALMLLFFRRRKWLS